MTDPVRVLLTTLPPADADAVVRTLVGERLVACGNLIPGVRSHYWWDGAVQHDEEIVAIMETPASRLDAAIARLRALHPYSTPKIVALSPEWVHETYAAWARAETTPRDG
jgi:periplasmic divalent cation tolerance protein